MYTQCYIILQAPTLDQYLLYILYLRRIYYCVFPHLSQCKQWILFFTTLGCVGVCAYFLLLLCLYFLTLTSSPSSLSQWLKRSVPGPRRRWRPRHGAVPHSAVRLWHRLRCQRARLLDERGEFSDTEYTHWVFSKNLDIIKPCVLQHTLSQYFDYLLVLCNKILRILKRKSRTL